ncbi:MAG: OprO/OprP family phosphate-selective porin [Limisphaerales bacterium]
MILIFAALLDCPGEPLASAAGSADEGGGESRSVASDNAANPLPTHAETNSPPAAGSAPLPAIGFRASWNGWKGLHLEVTRRSLLGRWIPGVTNLATFSGDVSEKLMGHGWVETRMSNTFSRVHLEETRLTADVGVKMAVDGAAYRSDDDIPGFDDGVELRRARLIAKGDCLLVLPVSYQIEAGYIPGQFYIENSYLQFKNLGGVGSLKAGQFRTPMSMENAGSSRDTLFMEAAAAVQALAPGVEAGFQIGQPILDRRMTWAFGLFTEGVGDDFGDATEDLGRAVGRITGLLMDDPDPLHPEAGRFLHLGLSGYLVYAGSDSVRYRSRPESHQAPLVIDTGDVSASGAFVFGAEAAWIEGPLTLQGEYLRVAVRNGEAPDVGFHGYYTSAGWFLTGESRPYDRVRGSFSRVSPNRNFDLRGGGWGAWEIAARFSHVDLNSQGVTGGRLTMGTVAVNWYLHSHMTWRYAPGFGPVAGRNPEGNIRQYHTRFEFDF